MAETNSAIKPWRTPHSKKITYILQNAHIIDVVNGTLLKNQTLVLSAGHITSITSHLLDPPPKTPDNDSPTKILDCTSLYILPGLIDSHVHMRCVPAFPDLANTFNMDSATSLLRQPYLCKTMLERGFTTVRDCGGANLALKRALEDGVFPGPRLFIAGHAISQTGGHGDLRSSLDPGNECCGGSVGTLARIADGVDACIAAARDELRMGADFIKIMTGGGVSSTVDALENVQFLDAEVRAIVDVAENSHTYVTSHAYTPASIRRAIENGARGIEHGNLLDEDTAKLMVAKGVYLTPTLVTYHALASDALPDFLPPESKVKNATVLASGLASLRLAKEAGVKMCYGTDLLGPHTARQSEEFRLRGSVLEAEDVLRSATVNPAEMLGMTERLGQVKEGFAADVLVVTRNPLEDITVLDEVEKHLLAVFQGGRVVVSRWGEVRAEGEQLETIR